MTDYERAVVMAHTGYTMLTGEKLKYFYEYVAEILGRKIYTHELANKHIQEEIQEKSKVDFILLCQDTLEELLFAICKENKLNDSINLCQDTLEDDE